MKIAKIIGTVVSTLKLEQYAGEKMLLARILNPDGSDTPETVIAFDRCQAGEGDVVLMIDEGNSARQTLQTGPNGVVRAVCVGYIDSVNIHPSPAGSFGA